MKIKRLIVNRIAANQKSEILINNITASVLSGLFVDLVYEESNLYVIIFIQNGKTINLVVVASVQVVKEANLSYKIFIPDAIAFNLESIISISKNKITILNAITSVYKTITINLDSIAFILDNKMSDLNDTMFLKKLYDNPIIGYLLGINPPDCRVPSPNQSDTGLCCGRTKKIPANNRPGFSYRVFKLLSVSICPC